LFHKNGPSLLELIRQSLTSTEAGYDMLAPKFDLTPFRTPYDLVVASVEAAGHVDSALDLCCGTGVAMEAMLPFTAKRLAGIDFSAGMLAEAQRRLESKPRDPALVLEFVKQDVMEMEFSNEFDLAVCFGALGHILPSNEREFVRRVSKALKPGGIFLFVTGSHPPIYSPAATIFRIFNAIMKIRNRLHKPEFVMYYLTFLLPEIEQKLVGEGFTVDVYRGLFPAPYQNGCLVMATKS
jgi:ubiquinone/menaquinone biosynthesis C-methylase UbiE